MRHVLADAGVTDWAASFHRSLFDTTVALTLLAAAVGLAAALPVLRALYGIFDVIGGMARVGPLPATCASFRRLLGVGCTFIARGLVGVKSVLHAFRPPASDDYALGAWFAVEGGYGGSDFRVDAVLAFAFRVS